MFTVEGLFVSLGFRGLGFCFPKGSKAIKRLKGRVKGLELVVKGFRTNVAGFGVYRGVSNS